MDLVNWLTTIAGILIGILIAGITTWITTRHDRQLAKESGSLRKPKIELALFGRKIGYGYPDNEDWFFIHPSDITDYALFPIKLTIYNNGDAATDEILISVHIPNRLVGKSQFDLMTRSTYPSLLDEKIKQSVDEIGNFSVISYLLPSLSPKVHLDLVLPLYLLPTLRDYSFPVKVEELTVKPHVRALYLNSITISISSGYFPPSISQVNIGAIPALSISDGVQKYLAIKPEARILRKFTSIWDPFKYFTELKVTNFLAFAIEDQVQDEKHKVFIMKLPDSFPRYVRLSWSSKEINEIANLDSGSIMGLVETEKVLKSERRFRFPEGNLVKDM